MPTNRDQPPSGRTKDNSLVEYAAGQIGPKLTGIIEEVNKLKKLLEREYGPIPDSIREILELIYKNAKEANALKNNLTRDIL